MPLCQEVWNPNRFQTGVPLAERPFNYGRRYHTLQFRRYLKRLVTAGHEAGVAPFWLVNQHPTWSFAQMAWHIEADYYARDGERDLVEHLGVAGFRAHVKSQGGIIGRLQFSGQVSDQPPREGHPARFGVRLDDATAFHLPGVARTHTGLCLLHDTGMIGGDRLALQALDERGGFFDDGLVFLPYWERRAVVADSDRVYVSVFVAPAKQQALAVLFNEKKDTRGLTVPLTVAASIEGIPVTAVEDLETGEPLAKAASPHKTLRFPLYIPPRDFRLLLLRAGDKGGGR
jgi:hypothetical protein